MIVMTKIIKLITKLFTLLENQLIKKIRITIKLEALMNLVLENLTKLVIINLNNKKIGKI